MEREKKLNIFKKLFYLLLPLRILRKKIFEFMQQSDKNTPYILKIIELRSDLLITADLLRYSIYLENESLAFSLLNKGITFFDSDGNDETYYILTIAINHNLESLVTHIVEKRNVDVNIVHGSDDTLLNVAIRNNSMKIANYIIDKGANIDNKSLITAIINKDTNFAKHLIDLMYDHNIEIKQNSFKCCLDSDNFTVAKYLLKKGFILDLDTFNISTNYFLLALYNVDYEIIDDIIDVPEHNKKIKKDIKNYIEFVCLEKNLQLGYYLFNKLVDEDSISIELDSKSNSLCRALSIDNISKVVFKRDNIIQIII